VLSEIACRRDALLRLLHAVRSGER